MSKRSELLDFALLGLLHEGPAHGYELRRRLNEALGAFRALSYGTLYPALSGLVDRGLIAQSSAPAPPASRGTSRSAPSASARAGGRNRIVYEITAAGKEAFDEAARRIDAAAYEEDGFGVRLAFFARTEADVRLRILEGRRSRVEEQLETVRSNATRNRERMDSWTSALQRHGEESTEREVRWLTELIDAERRHPTDPGPQP
ncbi:PadR family transcriptional regulator [Knoellia flava TL1]|uniref:PadR family transcriptional regulator n=2 Tax=Knoellia flava TaxID=913969 RepID=A0A8H9FXW3_9MICO|nr:PadR family transcriptional regulator [Knoellia flava]KGN30179.1 PadR family transcriptional regulator [Knoellia flava TL1]GGB87124.1 PadR family transcriptional regulator [Knoellia flava]